jgi:hypothetical protein
MSKIIFDQIKIPMNLWVLFGWLAGWLVSVTQGLVM